jgi:hypothetical protein
MEAGAGCFGQAFEGIRQGERPFRISRPRARGCFSLEIVSTRNGEEGAARSLGPKKTR